MYYKFELCISNNTYLEVYFYPPSTSSYRDSTVYIFICIITVNFIGIKNNKVIGKR